MGNAGRYPPANASERLVIFHPENCAAETSKYRAQKFVLCGTCLRPVTAVPVSTERAVPHILTLGDLFALVFCATFPARPTKAE
jgi:hypothetical protein